MLLCVAPFFAGDPRPDTLCLTRCNYRARFAVVLRGDERRPLCCGVHLNALARRLGRGQTLVTFEAVVR